MSDKLTAILSRITRYFLIAVDPGATDGERINATRLIQRTLKSVGADGHDVAELLTKPSGYSETELLEACEKYYAIRRGKEIEQEHRRAMVAAAKPIVVDDDVGDGVGDYSWLEIAQHCMASIDRFRGRDRDFVESVYRQLSSGRRSAPSPAQAPWLRDLFVRYFGGRI